MALSIREVIKTSVDLSRQDEGDEMFGSSSAARVIVRNCQATDSWLKQFMPKALMNWINSRFDKNDVELEESAAFDVVRAAVNLVLASMLYEIVPPDVIVVFEPLVYVAVCEYAGVPVGVFVAPAAANVAYDVAVVTVTALYDTLLAA